MSPPHNLSPSAPPASSSTRLPWGAIGQLAGSSVLVTGTFLPWLRSGERDLSVYDLRVTAHRLELLDHGWIVAPIAWVPLVLACALLARWAGRTRVAWAMAGAAAVYTAVGTSIVLSDGVATGPGAVISLVGAGMVLGAVLCELVFQRSAGRTTQGVDDAASPARAVTRPRTRATK